MQHAMPQHSTPSGLNGLSAFVRRSLDAVNALILSRTGSQAALVPEVANHLINSGGKRLRPMLTLACGTLAGARDADAHKLAAAVEFMHTATLLHDDVVDRSDLRRGHKTARRLWGNEASVLVGDFLLGQAFKLMVETGSLDALRILADAAAVIAEGEVMQLVATKNLATTRAHYFKVIAAKTAALFAAACEVGPALAGAQSLREPLRAYGHQLGLAFQLVDDALDYAGDAALGKNRGDDFREGKITLPVLLAYEAAKGEDKFFWERFFTRGSGEEPGELDFARARTLVQTSGALEGVWSEAHKAGAAASRALTPVPAGPVKDILADLVPFCLARES